MVEQSKRIAPWRKAVAEAAMVARNAAGLRNWFNGPLWLEVEFVLPRRQCHKKRRRDPADAAVRPDLDKLARSTKDALSRVLYTDDGQIVKLNACKRVADPGEPTGARIRVGRV